ncbi:MAG: nitroreductase family protein [Candidatus Omnitrophota bacterium]|nr:nitroreductase family protein [Candidatus Omnitrophota bacterium]
MRTFLELVRSRRSVRAFDKSAINRKDLELCVEAARLAPSACNSQPWKFIIIDDAITKKEIAEKVLSGPYKMNEFARESGAFAAIVSEKVKFPAWAGGKIRKTDFRRIDTGIASEHLVLQAQELGIGSCILGWFDEPKLKKILSVPRSKKIDILIALGYPARTEFSVKKLKDRDEIVSFNRY